MKLEDKTRKSEKNDIITQLKKENEERSRQIREMEKIIEQMEKDEDDFFADGKWGDEMRACVASLVQENISAEKIPKVSLVSSVN